jgi:filamentous hemagglutinin family protein
MRKTSSAVTSSKRGARFSPRRQQLLFALLAFSSLTSGGSALAAGGSLPSGGHFVGGAGAITSSGKQLTINQSTQAGIINWQSFSIGKGDSVSIDNGKGATLNRVTSGNVSTIAGSLKSTGSVYVVNSAGVMVAPSGKIVTTGTFVASTRDVSNTAFMTGGTLDLSGSSSGTVVNQGSITSADGDVVLVGKSVTNNGSISAAKGSASLVAGDNVVLQASGDDAVLVETGSGDVTNTGSVEAAQIALNAKGGNVYALAVNDGGVLRATGTATKDGRVYLTSDGGDVTAAGSISATNADGTGGTIEATAGSVAGTLKVAGTVDASGKGRAAKGGKIILTGSAVQIESTARIAANGTADGGNVFVGGDRHGGTDPAVILSDTPIADATTTTVAAGAQISVNGGSAGGAGNAGNVVIWSNHSTSYTGSISAQGGATGGNGGFIEVSGALLGFHGKVNTLARKGTTGQLLLDPEDVTIISSTDQSGAPTTTTNEGSSGGTISPTGTGNTSAPGNNSSYILNTDLDAALQVSSVTITTGTLGDGGTGLGNIHFGTSGGANGSNAAPIFWTSNNSLTLNAVGVIDSFGGTPSASTGGVNTSAPNVLIDAMGTGNITFNAAGNGVIAGGTVVTIGGNMTAHGGTITLAATSPGYSVVVGNDQTVTNSFVSNAAPGNIILQADVVRLGVLFQETGKVVTTGNVTIEPLTPGPVVVGNNNQDPGNSSTVGNTALINEDSIQNISANTLIIGSPIVTDLSLETPAPVAPFTGINAAVNTLELLTGVNGSISQDARTSIAVTTGATTGTEVSANGGLALVTGGAINLPDLLNFFSSVAIKQLPGGAGGNIVLQGNSTDDNTGSLNVTTLNGIAGISALPGSTVTLINVGTTTQDSGAAGAISASNLVLEGGTTGPYATYVYFDGGSQTYPLNNPNVVGSGFNGFTGAYVLNNTSNAISHIAGSVGSLTLADNTSLTIASNLSDNLSTPTTFSGITAYYSPTQTNASLNQTGSVKITDNGVLTIANGAPIVTTLVSGAPAGTAGGNVQLEAGSPNYGTGTVAANTGFVNQDGTAAFNVTGGGSWRVYSQDPRNNDAGGLTDYAFVQYGAANYYGDPGATGSGTSASPSPFANADGVLAANYTGTGNGFLYTVAPVAKETLSGTMDKTYDGTSMVTAPITSAIYSGVTGTINGDTVTFNNPTNSPTGTATATYNAKDVGTYTITITPGIAIASATDTNGAMVFGYGTNVTNNLTGTINARPITLTATTDTKTYDANSTATGTPTLTAGTLAPGDTLSTLSEMFDSPNASVVDGRMLVVAPTYTLSNAGDYIVTLVPVQGTINKAALTLTPKAVSVVYDGTTLTNTTYSDDTANYTFSGFQGSDTLGNSGITLAGSMAFDGSTATAVKNAGTYTQAQGSLSISSTNYTISFTNPTPNNYVITPKALTVTPDAVSVAFDGSTLNNTTYSDNTANYSITGFVGGETAANTGLTLTGSMAFDGSTATAVRNAATYSQGAGTLALTTTNGNYSLNFSNPTPNNYVITPASVTIAGFNGTRVYDGMTDADASILTLTNIASGDQVTISGVGVLASKDVGKETVTGLGTLTLGGANAGNYQLVAGQSDTFVVVTPATLTVTAVTQTRVYDGTTTSTNTPTVTGLQTGDSITGTLQQAYGSRNVLGTNGSTLSATQDIGVSDGNGGGNYNVVYVTAMGTITPEALTVTSTPNTKTFDGTTTATSTPTVTTGTIFGPDTGTFTETYNTPHAGTGLTLTPTGTINDGNGGNNYTVTFVPISGANPGPGGHSGIINPEAITISAVTQTKVYDGTTTSTNTPTLTTGSLFDGDTLTGLSQAYNSRNVLGTNGSTLTVNAGYTLTNASDYTVTLATAMGTITPEALTVTATPNTKTFDGTTTASATPTVTSGTIFGPDTGTFTETYNTPHAGTGLTLTPTGTINDGNGGSNYTVTFVPISGANPGPGGHSGIINPEAITISAVTQTKVYDGTTTSTNTPTLTTGSLFDGDTLTGLSQAYNSRNVLGTNGSTLTVNAGYTLTNASDYTVTLATAMGTITPEALTVTATPNTKSFDGTTTASATPTVTSGTIFGPDTGTFTETYNTPHAGTGLTLTPTGTISDGNGGNNYTVTFVPISGANPGPGGHSGVITPEAITISAVTQTKVYDGTTTSTNTPTLTTGSLFDGDTLTGLSQAYNSRNVLGTNGSTLTVNAGFTLTHASDYTVTLATAMGTITPELLTVTATPNTKTFDGTTTASATPTVTSGTIFGPDSGTFTETYNTPHAGTGLTLTPTGSVSDGNGGNNYQITFVPISGAHPGPGGHSGVITPEAITISALTQTKVYDGTTTSTDTPTLTVGMLFDGDTLTGLSQSYDSRNVQGTNGSTLTVNSGFTLTHASDYTVTLASAKGTITPELLTVTATPNTKSFDGTTTASATPTVTSGTIFSPDTGSFTEAYNTIHAGTGLTLTPTGSVSDGNGGNNYIITFVPISGNGPGHHSGNITPEAITISAATQTKVYDGTTTSTGTPTLTAGTLFNGDTLTGLIQAFDSKDVLGTNGSTLTVTAYLLTDKSDYAVTLKTAPGTITPLAIDVTGTRVYNGTPGVDGPELTITNGIPGDDIGITGTGTLDGPHVGTHTISDPGNLTITGGDSGNYTFTGGTSTVTVTPFAVDLAGIRFYDGTTNASSGILLVDNAFAGDTVTVASGTGTIATKNVGHEGITDFGTLTLGGASAGDYTLVGATGDVQVRPLVIDASGIRVYDGTSKANGSILTITNAIAGDNIGLSGIGIIDGPHVGDHTVTGGSLTLTGGDAGNYTLVGGLETVKVTPLAVVLTGTRVYDGGTDGDAGILTVTNGIGGDDITVAFGTSTIASRNVGNEGISDFGTLTLGGSSAGDYTLVGATGVVKVTPEMITVTAVSGSKTYDGTTTSTGTPIVISGTIFGTDSGSFIQTYGTQHAGTGLTLTPSGTVVDGNGGGNYIITFQSINTGIIDPRPIVVTGTRPFDNGTDASAGILTITNLIPGDSVTLAGIGTVGSPAVGPEPVTDFGGLALGGGSAGDYTFVGATGIVTITPTPPTDPDNKLPDQTASANAYDGGIITLKPQQNGVVTGTIATIDGTDYHPDAQLSCTLGDTGCMQNGVAPATTSASPQ